MTSDQSPPRKIDGHVHIVGNGSSGSGCWLRLRGWFRLQASFLMRELGLPQSALHGDLDRLYVERLLEMVKQSSFEAVMILAHDQAHHDDGRVMEGLNSFYVPNRYVLELAKAHPQFLPAVSIHPARPDALDELERCIAEGALMMKCLPNCQNINCSDPRYRKFWETMAKAGMVLLAHTGGELSMPVIRPAYSSPEVLRLPLECGVTVIAAHAATNSFLDPNYLEVLRGMFERYPKLYTDNAALNTPIRSKHLRSCLEPDFTARMVHGSDVPIPVSGLWVGLRGLIDWKSYLATRRIDNILERDYRIKLALGFPEATFTRLSGLLRKGN